MWTVSVKASQSELNDTRRDEGTKERTPLRELKFIYRLGVRSLANASRARQFNPLNPPGVGWVPLPQTNMAAVVGRACVVVRGRSCVVMRSRAWSVVRAWSVMCGRVWSCAVVRGRARVVVRGRAVLPASRPALPCCPLRGQHCRDTNERTNNI